MATRMIRTWCRAALVLWVASGCGDEPLLISPRPNNEAAGLNVSHPVLPGNIFDFRTCEAVLDGIPEHRRRQVHVSLRPQGEAPIQWAWWVNSTNTFDEPLFALASRDGQWTAGLWFERAVWASSNAGDDRACFHLFPLFGRIEPGASATVRGAFDLQRGSPEELRKCVRLLREAPRHESQGNPR